MDCHTLLQCPYPLPTPAKQRKRGVKRRKNRGEIIEGREERREEKREQGRKEGQENKPKKESMSGAREGKENGK